MAGSAVPIAKEPDVCCDSGVGDVSLEGSADFHVGHASWEAPKALTREIVPVIWGLSADCRGKAFISNADYVMSSLGHDSREGMIIDVVLCALRQTLWCSSREDISVILASLIC